MCSAYAAQRRTSACIANAPESLINLTFSGSKELDFHVKWSRERCTRTNSIRPVVAASVSHSRLIWIYFFFCSPTVCLHLVVACGAKFIGFRWIIAFEWARASRLFVQFCVVGRTIKRSRTHATRNTNLSVPDTGAAGWRPKWEMKNQTKTVCALHFDAEPLRIDSLIIILTVYRQPLIYGFAFNFSFLLISFSIAQTCLRTHSIRTWYVRVECCVLYSMLSQCRSARV